MLDGVENKSICYNRGCGQTFDPKENKEDSCTFHPGAPNFHDAYKGWSCCNKKCTDFTEFLNIKGCTKSFHSNVKPKESEKSLVDKPKVEVVYEYRPPVQEKMPRPPFESPQIEVPSTMMESVTMEFVKKDEGVSKEVSDAPDGLPTVGTICLNNACKVEYTGSNTSEGETQCFHHPGGPVFHEGAKFWSCCKKRSFDFEDFLNQKGCTIGKHCWVKPKTVESKVECRYDWHQTGSDVVVAVYAKRYDPSISKVLLNPVRLTIKLFFPESGGSFLLDFELGGVIDPTRSTVTMRGTKVEVTMRKAEPGSWSKLNIPRDAAATANSKSASVTTDLIAEDPDDEPVDLSDLS